MSRTSLIELSDLAKRFGSATANAWTTYDVPPDKATPGTVAEQESCRAAWWSLVGYAGGSTRLDNVTPQLAKKRTDHRRRQSLRLIHTTARPDTGEGRQSECSTGAIAAFPRVSRSCPHVRVLAMPPLGLPGYGLRVFTTT